MEMIILILKFLFHLIITVDEKSKVKKQSRENSDVRQIISFNSYYRSIDDNE